MDPLGLTGQQRLAAGIILGASLGFGLVKSGLARRRSVMDALTIRDANALKTLLFSLGVGVAMFQILHQFGVVGLNTRPATFWGSIIGGGVTGIGLAICGFFPASGVAGLAMGRVHAIWPLAGMLAAIPFVRLLTDFLNTAICGWNAPLDFRPSLADYLSRGQAALWFGAISIIFALFLEYALRSSEKDKP